MTNRVFFGATTAVAVGALAALVSSTALGTSASQRHGWHGARQTMARHVAASPSESKLSAGAVHTFETADAVASQAHVPFQMSNGTKMEVGIGSDGLLCFNLAVPGQAQAGKCGLSVHADRVSGVIDRALGRPQFFYGLAGDNVVALSVKTSSGVFPAFLRNGAFFASLPANAKLNSWVATLADGSAGSGDLSFDNNNPLLNQ